MCVVEHDRASARIFEQARAGGARGAARARLLVARPGARERAGQCDEAHRSVAALRLDQASERRERVVCEQHDVRLTGTDAARGILGARRPRHGVPRRLEQLVQCVEIRLVATGDENTRD